MEGSRFKQFILFSDVIQESPFSPLSDMLMNAFWVMQKWFLAEKVLSVVYQFINWLLLKNAKNCICILLL